MNVEALENHLNDVKIRYEQREKEERAHHMKQNEESYQYYVKAANEGVDKIKSDMHVDVQRWYDLYNNETKNFQEFKTHSQNNDALVAVETRRSDVVVFINGTDAFHVQMVTIRR